MIRINIIVKSLPLLTTVNPLYVVMSDCGSFSSYENKSGYVTARLAVSSGPGKRGSAPGHFLSLSTINVVGRLPGREKSETLENQGFAEGLSPLIFVAGVIRLFIVAENVDDARSVLFVAVRAVVVVVVAENVDDAVVVVVVPGHVCVLLLVTEDVNDAFGFWPLVWRAASGFFVHLGTSSFPLCCSLCYIELRCYRMPAGEKKKP
jgi:hypothetical protein